MNETREPTPLKMGCCGKCKEHMCYHRMDPTTGIIHCPPADDVPLPKVPSNFKSKAVLYDLFKNCKKCCVKKYVNRETNTCLACEGMP